MMGESLRQAFEMALSSGGSSVNIEVAGSPPVTVKALKHRDHGGEYFSFLEAGGLARGVVISRPGLSERWIVDEVEPMVTSDVVVKVKAYVHREDSAARPRKADVPGPVVINAHNSQIALQHGGHGNHQHMQVAIGPDLGRHIEELGKLITESALTDLDKEEAHADLERVKTLAAKPKTPDVLARINSKLGSIKGIVGKATAIGAQATVIIEAIKHACAGT